MKYKLKIFDAKVESQSVGSLITMPVSVLETVLILAMSRFLDSMEHGTILRSGFFRRKAQ